MFVLLADSCQIEREREREKTKTQVVQICVIQGHYRVTNTTARELRCSVLNNHGHRFNIENEESTPTIFYFCPYFSFVPCFPFCSQLI